MPVDRFGWGGVGLAQAQGDATEGFHQTQEGVVVGPMAYLFTTDGVLLVSELEGSEFDVPECRVIQRRCCGIVGSVADGEVDVLKLEGL